MKKLFLLLALTPYLMAENDNWIIVENYAGLSFSVALKGPRKETRIISEKNPQADPLEYVAMKFSNLPIGSYYLSISRQEPGILAKWGIGTRSPRVLRKAVDAEREELKEESSDTKSMEELYWNTEVDTDSEITIRLVPQTTEHDQRVIFAYFFQNDPTSETD
jgi:hypothetical protein